MLVLKIMSIHLQVACIHWSPHYIICLSWIKMTNSPMFLVFIPLAHGQLWAIEALRESFEAYEYVSSNVNKWQPTYESNNLVYNWMNEITNDGSSKHWNIITTWQCISLTNSWNPTKVNDLENYRTGIVNNPTSYEYGLNEPVLYCMK